MKNLKINRFRQLYSIFISIVTIVIGILFAYHVLAIYLTGSTRNHIYEKTDVITHLIQMIIPLIILFLLIILGEVFYKVLETNNKSKTKFSFTSLIKFEIRKIILNRNNFDESLNNEISAVKKAEINKIILKLIVSMICLGSFIFATFYLLNPVNVSTTTPNDSIVKMSLIFLPFVILSLTSIYLCTNIEERISKKEYASIRVLLTYIRKNNLNIESNKKLVINKINTVRIVLFTSAIIFIIVGVINGNAEDVLKKAIMICTECIGLG